MGRGLDRLNAVAGDKQLAIATAAVEIQYKLEEMRAAQVAHYRYQDELAKLQLQVLQEIRDSLAER